MKSSKLCLTIEIISSTLDFYFNLMIVQMYLINEDRMLENVEKYKVKTNTTFTENGKYSIIEFFNCCKQRVLYFKIIKYKFNDTSIKGLMSMTTYFAKRYNRRKRSKGMIKQNQIESSSNEIIKTLK